MSEKKVNLGFRATPARQKELLIAAANRETSIQQMIERGLDLLMHVERPPPSELTSDEKKWLDTLLRVMRHSPEMRALAINGLKAVEGLVDQREGVERLREPEKKGNRK